MKETYFVIEVATGDSKIAGKAIYEYETMQEAEASYHSKIGVALKSDLYDTHMCMIVNSSGGYYDNLSHFYAKPLPEVENETEDVVDTKSNK